MPEIINGKRKVLNPISRYYVEPFGEYLAELLKKSFVSPNMITSFNFILSVASTYLIWLGGPFLFLFAIMVQFQHVLDITDGHLARIAKKVSVFGQLMDYILDRLIKNIWGLAIAYFFYIQEHNVLYLYLGIAFLFGRYMHHYLILTVEKIYPKKKDNVKEEIKGNFISKFVLFFIDVDIQLHMLSLFAIINKLDIYLWFYAIYFNFVWILYMAYYAYKHYILDPKHTN